MSAKERGRQPNPLAYQADPIRASLNVLGRKWTFLILRDIAFLKLDRFGQIKRNNPGLTARVLSRRLKEMVGEGLVLKEQEAKESRYSLTERGEDAVYILLALLRYGMRHHMSGKRGLDEAELMRELRYSSPFAEKRE